MLSAESQVLKRHLAIFAGKRVYFAGYLQDDFPAQLVDAVEVKVNSYYFDYVNRFCNVIDIDFSLTPQWQADLLVYYWGKNKQEVLFQLMQLLAQADLGQKVLIVGENRSGVRSVEKLLAQWGHIQKVDSARRCGLYHFELTSVPHFDERTFWQTYTLPQLADFTVHTLPGVFSAGVLDMGTALLLSTLSPIKQAKKVLDMGCGAGVIGAYIKRQSPQVELMMSDIHCMALESSQRTLSQHHLSAEVVASDVFSHIAGRFDLIISNPPFHDGIGTSYFAVETLITQAKQRLKAGGELRIVANAFLPYPDLLDRTFGQHKVLAQTGKFRVYAAYA